MTPHGDPISPPHTRQEHRSLRVIALVELVKGAVALLAASGLSLGGSARLSAWVQAMAEHFHADARHGIAAWLGHAASPDGLRIAVTIAALYGVLHLVEGWGLWRECRWASWLGCISAALYLPFDVTALVHHPGHWLAWTVVLINVLVVWVLARDLLRHHRRRMR